MADAPGTPGTARSVRFAGLDAIGPASGAPCTTGVESSTSAARSGSARVEPAATAARRMATGCAPDPATVRWVRPR